MTFTNGLIVCLSVMLDKPEAVSTGASLVAATCTVVLILVEEELVLASIA